MRMIIIIISFFLKFVNALSGTVCTVSSPSASRFGMISSIGLMPACFDGLSLAPWHWQLLPRTWVRHREANKDLSSSRSSLTRRCCHRCGTKSEAWFLTKLTSIRLMKTLPLTPASSTSLRQWRLAQVRIKGIRSSSVMAKSGGIFTGDILPAGQSPLTHTWKSVWPFSVNDYYYRW